MTSLIYLAIYAGLLLFVVGCVRRVLQYSRTPLHLRWELYPVPHEDPQRAVHGGSYFESSEWWLRPQHLHRGGELGAMLREILLLRGLWEFNRPLWLPSFLFHFGLYLAVAAAGLMAASAGLTLLVHGGAGDGFLPLLSLLYRVGAWLAAGLCLSGALLLLVRRLTSRELKNYTRPADIFNLLFFIAAGGFLLAGSITRAPGSAGVGQICRGLLTFDPNVRIGHTLAVGLVLAAALTAYIPFTHMAHFIAKYFTYHAVRWDDRQNVRGGSLEARLAEYLTYRPTWAGPHIAADGKRSWAEIVAINPAQEARK